MILTSDDDLLMMFLFTEILLASILHHSTYRNFYTEKLCNCDNECRLNTHTHTHLSVYLSLRASSSAETSRKSRN